MTTTRKRTVIDINKIPAILKQQPFWVNWKYEPDEKGKPTKPPYNPKGYKASHSDPATWATFEQVLSQYEAGNFDGIGFCLNPLVDGFDYPLTLVGGDIDDCLTDGQMSDFAQSIISQAETYTEFSPSGAGLRFIAFGNLPDGRRKDQGKGFEIYNSTRFLTFTGNHLDGTPLEIMERSAQIEAIHKMVFGVNGKGPKAALPTVPTNLDDQEVIKLAQGAENSPKFNKLWNGDASGYPSQSEADLALCAILAFYTRDPVQLDRLFKQSSLYREKWDIKHNGDGRTYGQLTIDKALETVTEQYTSSKAQDRKRSKRLTQEDYIKVLATLGYTFTMNEMNDRLAVNDKPMSDPIKATIRADLRDAGYKRHLTAIEDAYLAHGYANQYHPIRDWLDSLQWDEQPQIATLASYFVDRDNIFYTWLKRWLIGCVAKIRQPGQTQNMMLVLDGPQNMGKSYFGRWLCSDIPKMFIESPLNPDNKDHTLRLISKFIWEVGELGATMRKADREALKFALTRQTVTERAPYGHFDIEKPITCNFIGTINDEGGFLSDPTGNRRFFTCELTSIDWDYTQLDINQVWAEANHLYQQGEPWQLTPDELTIQKVINARYRIDSYAMGLLFKYYDIDPGGDEWTSSAEILQTLGTFGLRGNDRANSMELSSGLKEMGVKRQKRGVWGYEGVTRKVA